jgi:Cu/Ag efflux pump CusA
MAVNCCNGSVAFSVVGHFHKAKTAGLSGVAVRNDIYAINRAIRLEQRTDILFAGVEAEIAHEDRSGLIRDSIATLQRDLVEEAIIVSLVIIVFLFHFRSAFIPILTLPIAVIGAFLPMYYLRVSSNIMSLGGIANEGLNLIQGIPGNLGSQSI